MNTAKQQISLKSCHWFFWVAVFLLILTYPTFTHSQSEKTSSASLQQQLYQLMSSEDLAGVSWFVADGDHVSTDGTGFANLQTRVPMTADTPVHVGSVAKVVVAIGVLRLIETSDLRLDSEVRDILSNEFLDNPWEEEAPVQVRHLLEHTAGLNNLNMWQFLSTRPTPNTPLQEGLLVGKDSRLKIRSKPGDQYSYSNTGYALLGIIIEKVSGQRYEEFLDQHVLKPLKMNQSTFHFMHQQDDAPSKLATGYLDGGQEILAQPMYLRPAGQFTTTARDMAKFASFLIAGGKLDGQSFIPSNAVADLSKPTTTLAAKADLDIGHGLALALRDRHGVLGQCHPGTTFGFRANICLFPEQKKAFFYSINTDSESADYEKFTIAFIEALNVRKTVAEISNPIHEKTAKQNINGFYLLEPANMQEFEWLDLMFNFRYLSMQGDQLVVRSLQNSPKQLFPVSDSLFRADDRTVPSHVLFKSGEHQQFSDGLNTYTRSAGMKLMLNWVSLTLGLLGLLYIVLLSVYRLLFRGPQNSGAILWPFGSILLFALPITAFVQQSFMRFGELTFASGLLTLVSLALPVSLLIAIALITKRQTISTADKLDRLAMLALLQFCLLLGYWNMLPIKYWGSA